MNECYKILNIVRNDKNYIAKCIKKKKRNEMINGEFIRFFFYKQIFLVLLNRFFIFAY